MEPLTSHGVDPVRLSGMEKQNEAREPVPRRKRATVSATAKEKNEEEIAFDTPDHVLDDLA